MAASGFAGHLTSCNTASAQGAKHEVCVPTPSGPKLIAETKSKCHTLVQDLVLYIALYFTNN